MSVMLFDANTLEMKSEVQLGRIDHEAESQPRETIENYSYSISGNESGSDRDSESESVHLSSSIHSDSNSETNVILDISHKLPEVSIWSGGEYGLVKMYSKNKEDLTCYKFGIYDMQSNELIKTVERT